MPIEKLPISAPWQGWYDQFPSLVLPQNSMKQITGWLLKEGRIQSMFKRNAFAGPPNGEVIAGARTFLDGLANLHTLILTQDQAYFLNQTTVYTPIGAAFSPVSSAPFAVEVIVNRVYFANGGQKVSYVDGSNNLKVAGDVPGTCLYLGKLASHLILCNTIEPETGLGSTPYPARVRWSASGNPNNFTDFSSGVNDIPDIEDQISGYATIGQNGFVFRTNGITVMSPTGIVLAPFSFENFSIGPSGVGNAYPYSLAVYGAFACFVGTDDIYYFDSGAPQRIGSKAKKAIFKDITQRTGFVQGHIIGDLAAGAQYLTYWLTIPQAGDISKVWVYHFDDQSWIQDQVPLGRVACLENIAIA